MAKKRRRKMHFKHPKHYEAMKKNGAQPKVELAPSPFKDPWQHRAENMTCSSCMWFSPKLGKVGRCRRRAPSPDGSIGWPVVFTTDWCGNHKLDELVAR